MSRKVRFSNAQGLELVGVLHPSPSDTILIMSHGFTGDKDEWGFFTRVAEDVNDAGYAVLRFDFSGCGESDDFSLTIEQQIRDLDAAIDFAKQEGYSNIVLYGHSLGGYVSLQHHKKAESVIASAPLTSAWEDEFDSQQLAEFAENGFLLKNRDKGVRKQICIDKQILEEGRHIHNEFLADIGCPVLLVHGQLDRDVPLDDSLEAITYLSKDSDLKIIKGANHGFDEHWRDVSTEIIEWLRKH